eukprot:9476148-Pyramimonas_sp.AAC.1
MNGQPPPPAGPPPGDAPAAQPPHDRGGGGGGVVGGGAPPPPSDGPTDDHKDQDVFMDLTGATPQKRPRTADVPVQPAAPPAPVPPNFGNVEDAPAI